eukprot:ANDGO_06698.mRNA.1 putative inactive nicotinamidase At3g16190
MALLVIDCQNDFLHPNGAFPQRHVDAHVLSTGIQWCCVTARATGKWVFWILSDYSNCTDEPDIVISAQKSAFLNGTHRGRKTCCIPQTFGHELAHPLTIDPVSDVVVCKRWYSAFANTTLHEDLQRCGVTELWIVGVATNVCVLASALDAVHLGYTVQVVSDLCAAATSQDHRRALKEMKERCSSIQTIRFEDILKDSAIPANLSLAGDGFTLYPRVLADYDVRSIIDEIKWGVMHSHGTSVVPRLVALQCEMLNGPTMPLYRHPASEHPVASGFSPIVDEIRRRVELVVGHDLNHGLLQRYRHGEDNIGEHSDKTLDIIPSTNIVNVSFGSTRTMVLRAKGISRTVEIPMVHGSVFILSLAANADYLHSIPKKYNAHGKPIEGERVSFTFRKIGTFETSMDSQQLIWGQGSPFRTFLEALRGLETPMRDTDETEMLAAFHLENRLTSSVFRWMAVYGGGFRSRAICNPKRIQGAPLYTRKLFYVNGSIPSMRAMMMLLECRLPFKPVRMKIMGKVRDTRNPLFLHINPQGKTPVLLEEDGTVLHESLAILTHLDESALQTDGTEVASSSTNPAQSSISFCRNLPLRLKGIVRTRMQETEYLISAYEGMELLFTKSVLTLANGEQASIRSALEHTASQLRIWESYIQEEPFASCVTIADVAFFPVLEYLVRRGLVLAGQYPQLQWYYDRMCQRDQGWYPDGWKRGTASHVNIFRLAQSVVTQAANAE